MNLPMRSPSLRRSSIPLALAVALSACGNSGDPAVCREPPPTCEAALISAVGLFSDQGCEKAIDSYWCGVDAQRLAECLHDAQVCVSAGSTRDSLKSLLAASVCAAEFAEWDGCFANGEGTNGGGGDDDDD